MELNEVGRRIVGQHWRLILAFVAIGLLVAGLTNVGGKASYVASTRLALDTPDPETQAAAQAIADTAGAIATSPTQVAHALASAKVHSRNATDIAGHHVSTRSLGTSGVLELSVSDRDPRIAAAIANALARTIIRARERITRGSSEQAIATLSDRIAGLNLQMSRLDAHVESLNQRAATAISIDRANSLRAARDSLSSRRDAFAAQRSVFQSELDRLQSADALQPQAAILGWAAVPRHADSSGLSAKLVLGMLLGAILGIGTAALIETFRPTLVGGESVAREFGMPLLGTLSTAPGEPEIAKEVDRLAERLRLAAEAAHVRRVCLVVAGLGIRGDSLAEQLDAAVREQVCLVEADGDLPGAVPRPGAWSATREPVHLPRPHAAISVRAVDFRSSPLSNGGVTGLVLVTGAAVKKPELADTAQLLRISPVPTLGLIAYGHLRATRPDDVAMEQFAMEAS